MTKILNRLPKMFLAAAALTVGTAGVAVAGPGHSASPSQYERPAAVVAQAGPMKMQRRAAKKAQRKQAKMERRQAKRAERQAKRHARRAAMKAQRIAAYDTNGDGIGDLNDRSVLRQKRFVTLDANRDGGITLRELQKAKRAKRAERLAKLTPEQRAKRAKRIAKRGNAQSAKMGKRFAKLDRNRNGVISRDEFVSRPKKAKRMRRGKNRS